MSKRADHRRRDKHHPKSALPARRVPSPDDAGGVSDRLARLLDTPHLAQVVPRLAPEVIHHLIRERGLQGCGALIAAATPSQVASVLDLDLWRAPAAGRDDRFDEGRFGLWIETLMNEGEAVAARIVSSMDRSIAVAGLSHYVRVFDHGVLPSAGSSDEDFAAPDAAASRDLEADLGGYVIRARTTAAWDEIVGLLVTLAAEYPDCFHALMRGCRRLSNSTPEPDGFHHLMLEPEQLLHDVTVDRDERRTGQGYLAPGDARAFLKMARQRRSRRANGLSPINRIAAAYFQTLDDRVASAEESASREEPSERSSADPKVSETIDAVVDLLAGTASGSARPRALLGPAPADEARVTPLQPLMEYVHDTDHAAYFTRSRELAFLANALVAGCSVYSRPFTTQEAWNAAVGICNLGLEVSAGTAVSAEWPSEVTTTLPDTFLIDHDLLTAFEAGWRRLHADVSVFVAGRLIATLRDLESVDPETQRDLYRLRRELERNRTDATPWRARDALDVIAILDMPAWASLCGLLSECPVLPAAMTAILDRQATSVSATAFECFVTSRQIRRVHEFTERLRDVLLQ